MWSSERNKEHGPKILILRLSSIGDIVLTTSFVRQCRLRFPNARIDYILKANFADLIRFNPDIDNCFFFQPEKGFNGLLKLRRQLKKYRYDYILDLHNNFRTRILTAGLLNTRIFRIRKNKIKRAVLVYFKINLFKSIHAIPEKYLRVGRSIGIWDDGGGLDLYWDNSTDKKVQELLEKNTHTKRYLVLAPGATYFTKRWPAEKFAQLINRILDEDPDVRIVLIGGKDEKKHVRDFPVDKRITNLIGELSLLESAAVIKKSKVAITNDSGVMHIASATQTPTVAIFGSTVRELGFFPFRNKHVVVERSDLKCRPCSHIGRNSCPLNHFKCMNDIRPDVVYDQYKKLTNELES